LNWQSTPTVETNWYALQSLWQGGEDVVKTGLPHEQLSPAWQILLLGDGSPTRHLRLLTRESIEVDVLDMSSIGNERDRAPNDIEAVPTPRLRRQVWVRTASGHRLAYAVSWWDAQEVDEYIQGIYYGHSPELEQAFNQTGPFWGRHYLFWHNGQPLTLIYEVFSPYLNKYLS